MQRELTCLMVSLAINVMTFSSIDRAMIDADKRLVIQKQRKDFFQDKNVNLEFVESPVKTRPETPEKPKKISNRDSVSQDKAVNKAGTDNAPRLATKGVADQLAQVKGGAAPARPQPERPAVRQSDEKKAEEPRKGRGEERGKESGESAEKKRSRSTKGYRSSRARLRKSPKKRPKGLIRPTV